MSDTGEQQHRHVGRLLSWRRTVVRRLSSMLGADERRRAITTALFSLSMTFWALVFAPIYAALGSARGALIIAVAGACCVTPVLLLRARGSIQLASNMIAAIVLITLLALSVFTGGFRAPAMIWLPTVPIITILLCGWHTGRLWLLGTLVSACAMYLLDREGLLPESEFVDVTADWLYILSLLGIITCTTLLCFIFDFNSRVLQQQLEVARTAAEQGSRTKSEFVALMSHEIRTPMNGVIGMLELLGNTEITKWQRECVSLAKQSADSLLRLLNDILDFSKIEAGKLELESIQFCLRDMIGDTLQALEFQAAEKKLELACQIPADVPERLVGDPGRLRQIITNLVGNALKFTERGEIVVRILPESISDGRVSLHFSVADTGVGIPADKQRRIFEAFCQADNSTTRKFGGTGLGLNISRRLIEMMGGRLTLQSEEGVGTTFEFTVGFLLGSEAAGSTDLAPTSLENVRVLVVDDNATSRSLLQELLSGWKMQVTCVENAQAALRTLDVRSVNEQHFALALLDTAMPDVDGWMLAAQIRSDSRFERMPLIMLSSSFSSALRDLGQRPGIVSQLRKPLKQSELLKAILQSLDQTSKQACRERTHSIPRAARSLRILLAEDGLINQKVAVGLLKAQGHSVTIAENGAAAVSAAERESFDLILMDVEMPQMDGLEATAAIREQQRSSPRRTPIVAMTAHALKGDRERFLAAGMDAYIPKPIDPLLLHQVIGQLTSPADSAGNQLRVGTAHDENTES